MFQRVSFETAAALTEGSHYALGNIQAAKSRFQPHVLVIVNGSDRLLQDL